MASDPRQPSGDASHPTDCEVLAGYRQRSQQRASRQHRLLDDVLRGRAAGVTLLLLDVDGVLTDGSLIYTESGAEAKAFNTQDGLGLKLVRQAGVQTGLITARRSTIVQRRAEELALDHIYQGVDRKSAAFREILRRAGKKPAEVCYMGDDWIDLAVLSRVGLATCPANAVPEVQSACHYVASRSGGHGAVREVCDLLVTAKGLHQSLLQSYLT
ncbi:MAG: HAD hydrolase family protein [Desulfofustis sp.]|jgi:3-deoxy-D-manno-octulosonate 8-phosphate phosphatase (KDO 8-P phosphatase)|nr:HAD hydrolase family protein [Desulfofustis sp.]